MCSPAFAAAGGVMSFLANFYSGISTHAFLDKQADAVEKSAADTAVQGRAADKNQQVRTARLAGAQRAAYGGSGVDVNVGSAIETQVDTAKMGELDAQLIKEDYQNREWALNLDAAILREQGDVARRVGLLGATSSGIQTAGSVADRYYQSNRRTSTTTQSTQQSGGYSNTPGGYRRRVPQWQTRRF